MVAYYLDTQLSGPKILTTQGNSIEYSIDTCSAVAASLLDSIRSIRRLCRDLYNRQSVNRLDVIILLGRLTTWRRDACMDEPFVVRVQRCSKNL